MEPDKKRLRRMFYTIEINLLLWFAAFGASNPGRLTAWSDLTASQTVILTGIAFAAIMQHWAYYALYRPRDPIAN